MKNISFLLLLACFNSIKSYAQCPERLFSGDTIMVCNDSRYVLIPNMAGSTQWSTGATSAQLEVQLSGMYSVRVSNGTCSVEDSVLVLFNSILLSPHAVDTVLCIGENAGPLKAWGTNLLWYTSTTDPDGSAVAPRPSTADTGTAYYYVSQTIQGCETPKSRLTVEVIQPPSFDLGGIAIIPCHATGIVLQTVAEKYTTYQWQDASEGNELLAPTPGIYSLFAQNKCGRLKDTVTVINCDTRCVYIPDAFSPNNDGLNDVFKALPQCPISTFRLEIFDRFGRKVFSTNNPEAYWDGKVDGKPGEAGSYAYYCAYDDIILKKDILIQGTVTLIR